jgi:phage terminase small subunit
MSRPRTPTTVLELRGGFKNRRQRAAERAGEPIPSGAIGNPPAHLSEAARGIWEEMAREGGQWLTGADRMLLEVACRLMAEFRASAEVTASQSSVLISVLNKLGFGPAERSKIKAPQAKEPEANPFEQFN